MILRRPLSQKGPMNAGSPAYHAQGNYNSAKRTYQPRGVNAIPLGIRSKTSPICTPPGNSSNTLDSSHLTTTLRLIHRKLVTFPVIAFLKEVEMVANMDKTAPTKVQDSETASGRSKGLLKVYYLKSMVQDPWKVLKPVIWKPHGDIRDSSNSWLPKSNSSKKAKLGETPTESTPQQSLAEYLAAAFTEAAGKDTVNDESGT